MLTTGLNGPYSLTNKRIDEVVTRAAIGAYALGNSENGIFYVRRIGRSDDDVGGRLKDYVGKYAEFKFGYLSSAKAAFEKECHLYHDFNPPDNEIHPARPRNTDWKCPRCKIFD